MTDRASVAVHENSQRKLIQTLNSRDGLIWGKGSMHMKNFGTLAIWIAALLSMSGASVLAQTDPGVRGGMQNTAGYLQYRGIPIPHPPVIRPNPTTGATINANELASFN